MTPSSRPKPESIRDIYVSFMLLALQGFGGVLAFMERELVERKKWLTREEFVEEWAVARTMPGPPALNISIMVGARYFGLKGALAAVVGMLMLPCVTILLLGLAYAQFGNYPQVIDALRGMGAVAAGLIAATGLKMLTALKKNPLGIYVCGVFVVLGFVCIALLRLKTVPVLVVLGLAGCLLAYRRVKP